jgi:acetyl esterase/lipase
VIVIPGGKWTTGDKSNNPEVSTYFAQRGFAAFAVTYRSALVSPFPAALEDLQTAVRWIRRHAADFGVDPHVLVAMGWSAGGHLAGLLGTVGKGPLDRGDRVAAVVSWSGPMDLVALVTSSNVVLRDVIKTFLGCGGGEDCTEAARAASPITYVDATDSPIYFANSTEEVIPVQQARAMAATLSRSDVLFEYRELEGRKHGAGYGANPKMVNEAVAFLGRALGEDAPDQIEEPVATPTPGKPGAEEAPPEMVPDRPVAVEESREPTPTWVVILALLGVGALVISTIQLGVALRALRLARQSKRDAPPPDGAGAAYALRGTEDTHAEP